MAVVWGQENRKVNAAVNTESIGLTKGKKRDLMKKQGPKQRFLNVEEWEEEILSRVDPGVHGKLKELVDEFKDRFPDTLPNVGNLVVMLGVAMGVGLAWGGTGTSEPIW